MDPTRFDTLAKSVSRTGTRRGLLRLLAAVPVAGGLLALGDPDAMAGKNGRNGRNGTGANGGKGGKGKSRHGRKGKDGTSRSRCNPPSDAATCAGTCGTVKNNCGKRVNCGPCSCGTGCHPDCQTCNPVTNACDPIGNGTCCNSATGACAGGVCEPCDGATPICDGGQCVECARNTDCTAFPNSFCDRSTGTCTCDPD
jgi:hypothetical protein